MALVLVFGADPVSVGGLAVALREAGHTPFAEHVAAAALPEIRAGLFDLILLDGRSPGADEVCRAAQHVAGNGHVPTLLLDDRSGGPGRLSVCVDAVFYKPVLPARIANVIGLLASRAAAVPADGGAAGSRPAVRRAGPAS